MKTRIIVSLIIGAVVAGCGAEIYSDQHTPMVTSKTRRGVRDTVPAYRYVVSIAMSPDIVIYTTNEYAVGASVEFKEIK